MGERSRNILVGLTATGGIVALAYLLVIFGEVPNWLSDTYPVRVALDDATGLAQGSRVRLNGIDIGFVDSLQIHGTGVNVVCHVESQYDIPANVTVVSAAALLSSAAHISFRSAPDEPPTGALPKDGSARLAGRLTSAAAEMRTIASRLETSLREQLGRIGEVTESVEKSAHDVGEMARKYTEVGERLNQILEQRSPAAVDRGEAKANFTTLLARTDARMAEIKQTVTHLNEILGDKTFQADLRETVANARKATAEASEMTGEVRARMDRLTKRYVALADDLSRSLARADDLLSRVQAGEGTAGKLIADPALYNNLADTSDHISGTLKQIKLLILKWKAEGLNIRF